MGAETNIPNTPNILNIPNIPNISNIPLGISKKFPGRHRQLPAVFIYKPGISVTTTVNGGTGEGVQGIRYRGPEKENNGVKSCSVLSRTKSPSRLSR